MSRKRLRAPAAVFSAIALTATLGAGFTDAAAAPSAASATKADSEIGKSGTDLAPDEVGRSKNMTHLANVKPDSPLKESTGTDIAFQNGVAFVGNYEGFSVWDVKNPKKPRLISQVACPGGQGDVSISGDLLYYAVDSSRSDDSCSSTSQSAAQKSSWEGVRIFDVSDLRNPKYVKAVETACGSHTQTLVPGKDKGTEYIYVSSYAPSDAFPDCQKPHDAISIIEVSKKNPAGAKVVSVPNLFPDGGTTGPDLLRGGTEGCHDITAYPSRNIAAGACMGDGIIMDIADPAKPKVIERVSDPNFAFWHSATFNNNGTKVVFTDELGGGGAATCNEETGPTHGANAIYTMDKNKQLNFASYFKIDRHQFDTENCVSHNGSLIPVAGKDLMVQSWYMGGTSVWDFTDAKNPREIGYFERGPAAGDDGGGTWSSYYYNGHIFSSDLGKGFDVLKIRDPRTAPAEKVKMGEFNPQSQPFVNKAGSDD